MTQTCNISTYCLSFCSCSTSKLSFLLSVYMNVNTPPPPHPNPSHIVSSRASETCQQVTKTQTKKRRRQNAITPPNPSKPWHNATSTRISTRRTPGLPGQMLCLIISNVNGYHICRHAHEQTAHTRTLLPLSPEEKQTTRQVSKNSTDARPPRGDNPKRTILGMDIYKGVTLWMDPQKNQAASSQGTWKVRTWERIQWREVPQWLLWIVKICESRSLNNQRLDIQPE